MHYSYSSLVTRVTALDALLYNKIYGSGHRGDAQLQQQHSGGRGELFLWVGSQPALHS